MNIHADISRAHRTKNSLPRGGTPRFVNLDDIKVPGGHAPRDPRGKKNRQTPQQTIIRRRQSFAALMHRVQTMQLREPQRRLQIRHAIIKAEIQLFIIPGILGGMFHHRRVAR